MKEIKKRKYLSASSRQDNKRESTKHTSPKENIRTTHISHPYSPPKAYFLQKGDDRKPFFKSGGGGTHTPQSYLVKLPK